MNAPHTPLPTMPLDEMTPRVRAYVEELRAFYWASARRAAQLQAELDTARERWAHLKAIAVDADRMKHTIDVVGFMRHIEADITTPEVK